MQQVDEPVKPADETAEPIADAVEQVEEPAPSVPAAPAPTQWTVAPGESLWRIAQQVYGASDTTTAPLVDLLFALNRNQLTEPGQLAIGMTLELAPTPARS